jgi:hypothetical protein
MKYIDAAMERLKTKQSLDERDLSLVERILAGESDPNTAYILALDLILVGIDTVSSATLHLGQSVSYYSRKLRTSQYVFTRRITSVANSN